MARCELREGNICLILKNKGEADRCEMPENLTQPCPFAISRTGDRSFGQALLEYRKLVAQKLSSPKA